MMGPTHAATGVAAWLTGTAAVQLCGGHPGIEVYVVGTAVCAGWAIAPDLDHKDSLIARAGGPLTRMVAAALGRFGAWVHWRTKTVYDRPDRDGHRTVTHTGAWALLWGLIVTVAQRWAGPFTSATLVFIAAHVGVQALLPPRQRRFRSTGIPVGFAVGAGLGAAAYTMTPGGGWWLGLAVGGGSLIHCLGDAWTNSGCPIMWPIPIGRRPRRWYPVGPPPHWRFDTGSDAGDWTEKSVVRPLSALLSLFSVVAAAWPVLWPVFDALVRALSDG